VAQHNHIVIIPLLMLRIEFLKISHALFPSKIKKILL
jgi:hypothetical protein